MVARALREAVVVRAGVVGSASAERVRPREGQELHTDAKAVVAAAAVMASRGKIGGMGAAKALLTDHLGQRSRT